MAPSQFQNNDNDVASFNLHISKELSDTVWFALCRLSYKTFSSPLIQITGGLRAGKEDMREIGQFSLGRKRMKKEGWRDGMNE